VWPHSARHASRHIRVFRSGPVDRGRCASRRGCGRCRGRHVGSLPRHRWCGALICGPLFWTVARQGWRTAWRVVISDQGIEASRYGGRRVELPWDSIAEVQHSVRRTIQGPLRLVRLVSIDRQREVIFNDRLPRFEELMRLVEAQIRHVGPEEPTSWGRLLLALDARQSRTRARVAQRRSRTGRTGRSSGSRATSRSEPTRRTAP